MDSCQLHSNKEGARLIACRDPRGWKNDIPIAIDSVCERYYRTRKREKGRRMMGKEYVYVGKKERMKGILAICTVISLASGFGKDSRDSFSRAPKLQPRLEGEMLHVPHRSRS